MSIFYLPPNAIPHLPADIHADQIGEGNLKASLRATVPATVYDADTGGALADPGDAIGRIEDGTANSIDLKQSSVSLRPLFGQRLSPVEFHYASFDFVDDKLATDAITGGITGQAFVAGAGGCYVTDLTVPDGGTFEIGRLSSTLLDTWTDAPTNILSAVAGEDEQVFDALLRSGDFTDEEIARLEAYYIARGGKGLLVEGPELITNGTFETDTTGWTAHNSAVLSVVSNRMRVTNGATGRGGAGQSFTTTVGTGYRLVVDVIAGTWADAFVYVGSSVGNASIASLFNVSGAGIELNFIAQNTTTWITLFPSTTASGYYTDFDNVSVKQLIPREEL